MLSFYHFQNTSLCNTLYILVILHYDQSRRNEDFFYISCILGPDIVTRNETLTADRFGTVPATIESTRPGCVPLQSIAAGTRVGSCGGTTISGQGHATTSWIC